MNPQTARIAPVEEPYEPQIHILLSDMMPAGVPPIRLFRTFARNPRMTAAMRRWGRYELSKDLSLDLRCRELVIDRTCARCGAEYEWGVHVAFFADRAGLTSAQIRSIVRGDAEDACWTEPRERALLRAVDALHDKSDLEDPQWADLESHFTPDAILDLLFLCGWYHAISFVARAARVELETGAPRFADY